MTSTFPRGGLDQALSRFGRQAGVPVSVNAAMAAGLASPGVRGRHTASQALRLLLAGTGLQGVRDASGEYTLRKLPDGASSGIDVATLTAITITGAALGAATEGTDSYAARAVTIGKTTQTLREIPQSVSVITRRQMEDQNLTSVADALARSTGVINPPQTSISPGASQARGFQLVNRQFDGVPFPMYGYTPPDTAIYDRIEVLRGAAGLLQGTGDPSGVVNLVRKRPGKEFAASAAASLGSWNNYRGELDVGAPLNASGTVRGRAVATWQDRDNYVDNQDVRQLLGYGIIEADLTPDTLLTFGAVSGYTKGTGIYQFGLPRGSDGSDLGVSRRRSFDPPWAKSDDSGTQFFASLEQRLGGDWKAKLSYQQEDGSSQVKRFMLLGPIDPATGGGAGLLQRAWDWDRTNRGADFNVSGSQTLWGREHRFLLGVNWQQDKSSNNDISAPRLDVDDFFTFDPTQVPEPDWSSYATNEVTDRTDQLGLYGSAHLKLADPLTLILGGRLSWWKNQGGLRNLSTGVASIRPDNEIRSEFTPYAGVVYDLNGAWSVYASYADIFKPQTNALRRAN